MYYIYAVEIITRNMQSMIWGKYSKKGKNVYCIVMRAGTQEGRSKSVHQLPVDIDTCTIWLHVSCTQPTEVLIKYCNHRRRNRGGQGGHGPPNYSQFINNFRAKWSPGYPQPYSLGALAAVAPLTKNLFLHLW